ncbi:MAG: diguanylate cyclase [Eubacteriaceae bacterium]|nr:diguanylate cyclase [Eubacteriaceae bacterium]
MKELCFKEFFIKSPTPYSCQKVILDEKGIPYSYEIVEINKACESLFGLKAADMKGKKYKDAFPQSHENSARWDTAFSEAMISDRAIEMDLYSEYTGKWLHIEVFPLDECHFGAVFEDSTKEHVHEKDMEAFLKVNLDMLCVANMEGTFVKVNNEFENVLGYSITELEGKSFLSMIHEEDLEATLEILDVLKEQKPVSNFVNRYRCKNGEYKYIEWRSQPNGEYVYASARDITEKMEIENKLKEINEDLVIYTKKLQAANQILKTLSITDELTGLYNRHYFEKRITEELDRSDRYSEELSMIIFDLDQFKKINDTWGHPMGDLILKKTAEITVTQMRKSDEIFRLGGEEFAIILPHNTLEGARTAAERLRKALNECVHPEVGKVTCSFGVAERRPEESFDSWYRRADEALYGAKNSGRNRVICCD